MRWTSYGQKKHKNLKHTPDTRLLRHLLGALSDAKAIKGVSGQDPAIRGLAGLVTSQIKNLDQDQIDQQTLGDILASGEPKLIGRVIETQKTVVLESYQWRRLLRSSQPEGVRKLIESKTLSVRNATPHIFARVAASHEEWSELADLLTDYGVIPDRDILDKKYRGLFAQPRVANHAAQHLKKQVVKFPAAYQEFTKGFLGNNNLYRAFLMQRAGVDMDKLASTSSQRRPTLEMLKDLLRSGHARIQMHMIAPTLEATLIHHKEIAQVLHDRMR